MTQTDESLVYRENEKHKPGCSGNGPPRWFTSAASLCPDDVSLAEASAMLQTSVVGKNLAHPNKKARYAIDGRGRFFSAYPEDGGRIWHGYPVSRDQVPAQVPTTVLREFVKRGLLSYAEYKKLLGNAS